MIDLYQSLFIVIGIGSFVVLGLFAKINAELKLFGDVRYGDPLNLAGTSVSIVVINPYYNKNCNWITTSVCNQAYSNKNWQVLAVSHDISEGTFTTTLKVELLAPDVDDPADDEVGGKGQGTERVDAAGPGAALPKNAQEGV